MRIKVKKSKKFVTIDKKYFKKVKNYNWYFNGRYIMSTNKDKVYLHRLIANTPKGYYTDHADGNVFNCRISNLRICNQTLNRANSSKKVKYTSKYKGVHKKTPGRNWSASIAYKGQKVHLGSFKREKEAAEAYNKAAYKFFGRFAKLNRIK